MVASWRYRITGFLLIALMSHSLMGQRIIGITASSVQSGVSYYVSNDGNDSYPGTSEDSAWQTIAQVNASSFDPGTSIFFNKGDEWREQLTIPSSGSEGRPITFASYGTGTRPILNGSDLITGWTDSIEAGTVSGTEDWSETVASSSGNTSFYNIRQIILASDLSETGTHIRIHVVAHNTAGTTINGASIGLRDGSTDDFSAAPTRITFGGENDTAIAADGEATSDWVEFSTDGTTDLLVHFYGSSPLRYKLSTAGDNYESTSSTDFTMTSTVSFSSSSYTKIIDRLDVGSASAESPDSVWQADLASDPKIVILNDTLGVEALTKEAVDSTMEWFWGGGILYVYSEDSIDNTYTVEAGARDYGIIDGGDETYVTIDDLEIKNSRKRGIMFLGDVANANILIDNCYVHHTREQGFYLNGYDNCRIEDSRSEYTGSGFYVSPNSNYNTFARDTSMYNVHYVNGVNTNGLYMDGHGFGIEESDSCIVEYCVAEYNDDGGFVVDNNVAEDYDVIFRYNKALASANAGYDGYSFGVARMGNGSVASLYYNLGVNYGYNSSSNFFVNVDSACTVNVWNNTFVNESDLDCTVARWYDTEPNGSIDSRNNIIVSYRTSASSYHLYNATSDEFTHSDYNLFYGPNMGQPFKLVSTTYADLDAWTTGTGLDENSVEDNPDFTSEFTDFSLQVGSPAINAGTDVGLTQDILGNPMVGLPDMGAYEKQ